MKKEIKRTLEQAQFKTYGLLMTILVHLNDLSDPIAYDLAEGQEATEQRCRTAFLATPGPQGLVDVADAFGTIVTRYDFCPH